ncbi:MAG: Endo-1,4-beta-xylanase A precursor [Firmicutes bacterium ADurb.Bin419]|nr:MAG: Endo-1,4-beta-xylanase A precursor [Firmicutes bacterium ADurb.Bin419]
MQKWSDLGIIKGSGSGNLRPDDNITRAEVATIINKVFGFFSKSSTQFSDVTQGAWYSDELLKAREAGYYNGYTGNISNADSKITREDTSVMLLKVFSLDSLVESEATYSFIDSENISKYALSAVNKLSNDGIIKGYTYGRFLPKSYITRAEFITVMDNLVKELFNAPGTYGSMNVSGHVIINHPSVELKDMNINGNLYLTEGIGSGIVTLNNVSLTDTAYISGGTDTIKIINTKLNRVEINVKNTNAKLSITPTPTSTITPTLTPTSTSTPALTSTLTPTSTPALTSSLTPTPTSTPTSTPVSTPTETVLKLESATCDNLKEVVLLFNKAVQYIDEAEDENNYSASDEFFSEDNRVIYAELSPDRRSVTLLLLNALSQQDDLSVTVKSKIGLKKDSTVNIDYIEDTISPTIT